MVTGVPKLYGQRSNIASKTYNVKPSEEPVKVLKRTITEDSFYAQYAKKRIEDEIAMLQSANYLRKNTVMSSTKESEHQSIWELQKCNEELFDDNFSIPSKKTVYNTVKLSKIELDNPLMEERRQTYVNADFPQFEFDKINIFSEKEEERDDCNCAKILTKKKKKKKKYIFTQQREGDWYCFFCSNLNFRFRKSCNRCKKEKTVD